MDDSVKTNSGVVSEWISVKDSLPEQMMYCLLVYKGAVAEGFTYTWDGIPRWCLTRTPGMPEKDCVTHWMPLPEPPKEM